MNEDNSLSDEAICEYANSLVKDKYDQYQQSYADGAEHGMLECRRRAEANPWQLFPTDWLLEMKEYLIQFDQFAFGVRIAIEVELTRRKETK